MVVEARFRVDYAPEGTYASNPSVDTIAEAAELDRRSPFIWRPAPEASVAQPGEGSFRIGEPMIAFPVAR
jgi:hypothetical protein